MATVKQGAYRLAKIVHDYKNFINQTIEIPDEEAIELGLIDNGNGNSSDNNGGDNEGNEEPINNKYCNLPARLNIENVLQAPVLYTSCESEGEFCTITANNEQFIFEDSSNHTSTINIITAAAYNGYLLGLAGFIVGKPNVPDDGEPFTRVCTYDLCCPNCYNDYNIIKPLKLQTGGYAKCNSCARTYNLNTGEISEGPIGNKLFRYRCSYLGNSLIINNG